MLYVFRWNFYVDHEPMTSKGDLLKLNLYLYIIIYRNMTSMKDLGKLIEKWIQFCDFNFSYKKHLEILIVLRIRFFLMVWVLVAVR